MSAASAQKPAACSFAGPRAAKTLPTMALSMLRVSRPVSTQAQMIKVRLRRLKKMPTMISPARPYAPSTSPFQSRAACTKPNASSHQFRRRSNRRACLTGTPDSTCRENICTMP